MKNNLRYTVLCSTVLLFAGTVGAMAAQVTRAQNTPQTGGQLNRCWGEMASQLAQLDTSGIDANGGAMGLHSKDNNAPDTTFRDSAFGGTTTNRSGIGNGTANVNGPHGIAPGDGGLGAHAINNGSTTTEGPVGGLGFSVLANPMTGQLTSVFGGPGGDPVDLHCSLEQQAP